MPKFYKQNKKRFDPRYFMDERLEEAVIEPGLTKAGKWPGVSPADRVKDLATKAMDRQKSGEIPPWEEDPAGPKMGLFDGAMEDGTPVMQVLNMVRKQLNIPGGTAVLQKFDQLLKELGVILTDPERHDHEGFDPGADEMEDSLKKTQSALSDEEYNKRRQDMRQKLQWSDRDDPHR